MKWGISVTAPSFTPAQEKEEKDTLPAEERAYIDSELFGTDTPFEISMSEAEVTEAVVELRRRIDEMPVEEKEEYLEALERVPDLVERETNPLMFLRCDNFDVEVSAKRNLFNLPFHQRLRYSYTLFLHTQAASKRLVAHWKHRKELFGPELAFCPMTQAGAMRDNIGMLRKGHVTLHPCDEKGRPVIFLDRVGSCNDADYERTAYLRTMWYVFQTVAEEERFQKTGYVMIINLKDWDPASCGDRIGAKKTFLYWRECLCPRMKGYHATYGSTQTPVKIVEPAIREMQGKHIRLHLINHYGFDSENLKSLALYGLKKEHLSQVIGGDLTVEDHLEWLRQRAQVEEGRG